MSGFSYRSTIEAPPADVYAWHARLGTLERLLPPWAGLRVVGHDGSGLEPGLAVRLEQRLGPLRVHWEAVHTHNLPGREFRDEARRGPFRHWRHTHRFLAAAADSGPDSAAEFTVVEDELDYALPLAPLGDWVAGRWVRGELARMFRFRHQRMRDDLALHASWPHGPWRIAMSGASGLVGRRLSALLTSGGHRVLRLVRGPEGRTPGGHAGRGEQKIPWQPDGGRPDAAALDPSALENLDALVHLSGETIAGGRWSAVRKARILSSRVESTALLARTLAGLTHPPRVWVVASAVGIYGNTGSAEVDEQSAPGEAFLAQVCRAWEAAVEPARQAGIRVVHLRMGMVLAADGGALPRLLLPFRLGLGGPIGNGHQGVPWVAMEDLLAIVHRALWDDALLGPVNTVSPRPCDSRDFGLALGRVLHRPAVLPLPAPAVRLGFGEMGQALLLEGQRVLPRKLAEIGFVHRYPALEGALRVELGLDS